MVSNMAEQNCCCQSQSCCCSQETNKEVKIDFLYLDLTVCERCQGTESNLDQAIQDVSQVLKAAGYQILVNKVNVNTRELAYQYKFVSSPTIRINGMDISMEVKESSCKECGDLCGDEVDCRVWTYEGTDYTEPPKEMIINAILKYIYSEQDSIKKEVPQTDVYEIPANLERFFAKANC
mgnify:FL=1